MPEDRTLQDHGLAHPQPERGRIPQPLPEAGEDQRELVPNQSTYEDKPRQDGGDAPRQDRGAGGRDSFIQTPD